MGFRNVGESICLLFFSLVYIFPSDNCIWSSARGDVRLVFALIWRCSLLQTPYLFFYFFFNCNVRFVFIGLQMEWVGGMIMGGYNMMGFCFCWNLVFTFSNMCYDNTIVSFNLVISFCFTFDNTFALLINLSELKNKVGWFVK